MSRSGERFRDQYQIDKKLGELGDELEVRTREIQSTVNAQLAEVRRHFPQQRVVMLSMYGEERYAVPALRAGAVGYITKTMAAEELVKAIRKVMEGGTYIGPRLAELLAEEARAPEAGAPHERLTARENEILTLIGAGLQIKQVAAELGISVSSVNTYRLRIFQKMDLHSNAALIRYAVQHGLVG